MMCCVKNNNCFSHSAEPELLILDEPTVGVDPVLRRNIWDHLVEITKLGKKTVIITTHYIEETRQAHVVSHPYNLRSAPFYFRRHSRWVRIIFPSIWIPNDLIFEQSS